jgi:hypothetical protein
MADQRSRVEGEQRSSAAPDPPDDAFARGYVARWFGLPRGTVITMIVAVVAFALGLYGFEQVGDASFANSIYNTLGLFTLSFNLPPGVSESDLPVALEVARFLAPAVTVIAVGGLAARMFRDQLDVWRARRSRGHVIVCGLGRAGLVTAERLQKKGKVVAIERDPTCPGIVAARSRRIPVVLGDATSRQTLARAGVSRAGRLIWSANEWVYGQSVVERVQEDLAHERTRVPGAGDEGAGPVPTCLVRVRDLGLCTALRGRVLAEHQRGGDSDPEVDFFNEAENAAQRLLWKATRSYALADDQPVELWVLGDGALAEAIVVQAARNWWGSRSRPQLAIHLFAENAAALAARIGATWPEVCGACRLEVHEEPPEAAGQWSAGGMPLPCPDAAFVLVDGEERAVQIGLRLIEQSSIPHVVAAATDPYTTRIRDERLVLFDPRSYGLGSDVLLFDTYELLGRMIHQHYVLAHSLRPDGTIEDRDEDDPLGTRREWGELDPLWQASNRQSAAYVVPNLIRSGLRISRLAAPRDGDTGAWVPSQDPDRVDEMAEREHHRWKRFMEANDFVRGPKSNDPRQRPDLADWSAVAEPTREYTRTQVREYPRLLAQLGFAIRTDPNR